MTFFEAAIFPGPIFNALIGLYNVLGDIGLAIIAITLIVRVAFLPLANKAFRAQRRLQALQPELKKLQDKHKDDRETLAKETMAFYQKEGVNPASSCLPTLVQLPVLFVLFFAFKDAIGGQHLDALYSFISRPAEIDPSFLGLLDLSKNPSSGALLILPIATGVATFIQAKMVMPKGPDVPAINKQLTYILPLVTAFFSTTLPAALALYWLTSTVFTIIQQAVIMRELPVEKAKAEAVADWNAANPGDPVADAKATSRKGSAKTGKSKTSAKATKTKKGSTSVTVRTRGQK